MFITAIALKRFETRHGKLPATLQGLVPEFLPSLPTDLMDGRPLRYRLNADPTYTLYSINLDSKDDRGNPAPTQPAKTPVGMWEGRDAVWPTAVPPD